MSDETIHLAHEDGEFTWCEYGAECGEPSSWAVANSNCEECVRRAVIHFSQLASALMRRRSELTMEFMRQKWQPEGK